MKKYFEIFKDKDFVKQTIIFIVAVLTLLLVTATVVGEVGI